MALLGFGVLVLGVLVLLGYWQRAIEERQSRDVLAEIRDAKSQGTDKPLAQHPQIDVQACIGCGSCVAACPEDGVLGLVDGVARVIHGARCIGHGLCADACPVAAVTVGLGELAARPDLPVLSENLETSLPGVYVAGELGGFALIRLAIEQGVRVMREIQRDLRGRKVSAVDVFDVLIVGAGPAGIAATLEAKALGLKALTIDQSDIGGTVRKYPRRKLTLTGRVDLPLHGPVKQEEFLKEELIAFWEALIAEHRLRIETGVKLEGLEPVGEGYCVRTSQGALQARRVVLALGRGGTPRKLGVPGEELEKTLYHLVDAASYRGQRVLVVGGGDSAIEAATALASQAGNQVTISYRRERFVRLKPRNAERVEEFHRSRRLRLEFDSEVRRIDPQSVTLRRRSRQGDEEWQLPNDFVFVCAGGEPPYALLQSLGVRLGGDPTAGGPLGPVAEETSHREGVR
ncbi:MAG: NAD(P)-binding domain-containing protein [Planctomycetota bacterium]